jgi:hypothetical protein
LIIDETSSKLQAQNMFTLIHFRDFLIVTLFVNWVYGMR